MTVAQPVGAPVGARRDRRRVGGQLDYRRATRLSRLSDRGADRARLLRGGLPAALEWRTAAARRDRRAARRDRGCARCRPKSPPRCRDGRRRAAAAAAGRDDAGAGGVGSQAGAARANRPRQADHQRAAAGACDSRVAWGTARRRGMAARLLLTVAGTVPRRISKSRRSIACWSPAPSTSSTPRPLPRAWSPAPAPTCTPRCWPRCARCRVRFTAARATGSSRCSRRSRPGMRSDDCLDAFARKHRLPPGFGHAIYPAGDPRAVLLQEPSARPRAAQGPQAVRDRAQSRGNGLEARAAASQSRFLSDRVRPDARLSARDRRRDLRRRPRRRMDRARLEQYADNRLIRPRMRYRGAADAPLGPECRHRQRGTTSLARRL